MMCSRLSMRRQPLEVAVARRRLTSLLGTMAMGLVVLSLGGCLAPHQRRDNKTPVPETGYVSVARLMPEHVLYPTLTRLDQEIAQLQSTKFLDPVATRSLPVLPSVTYFPTETPLFPLADLTHEVTVWNTLVAATRSLAPVELHPDLRIRLELARRQIEAEMGNDLDRAASVLQRQVTETRAKAVQARQEALNNAELDLSKPELEAAEAARQQRSQLWEEIEAETDQAQQQVNTELARLRSELRQRQQQRLTAVQEEILTEFNRRVEITAKSGSKSRVEMSKAFKALKQPVSGLELHYQPDAPNSTQMAHTADLKLESRLRLERQLQRLRQQRHQIALLLFEATKNSIEVVAFNENIDIEFQSSLRQRRDITDDIRPLIRDLLQP